MQLRRIEHLKDAMGRDFKEKYHWCDDNDTAITEYYVEYRKEVFDAEIGYRLVDNGFEGKGHTTAGLIALCKHIFETHDDVHEVCLRVFDGCVASTKVAEKSGFVRYGNYCLPHPRAIELIEKYMATSNGFHSMAALAQLKRVRKILELKGPPVIDEQIKPPLSVGRLEPNL